MAKRINPHVGTIEEIRRALRAAVDDIEKIKRAQVPLESHGLDGFLPAPVEVSGGISSDKAKFSNIIVTDRKGNWQRFGAPDNNEILIGDLSTDLGFIYGTVFSLLAGSIYFEVYLRATSGTVYADLYDKTVGRQVPSSQVSTSSTDYVLVRSAAITLDLNSTFRPRFARLGTDTGDGLGAVALAI